MNEFQRLCLWASATDPETLEKCPNQSFMARGALGILFLVNYIILACVWLKVGHHYGGWIAAIVLGGLIPNAMLAFDRLLALDYRVGPQKPTKWIIVIRVWVALSLTILSSLTFTLERASSTLHERQLRNWNRANFELRQELKDKAEREIVRIGEEQTALKEHRKEVAESESTTPSELATARASLNKALYQRGNEKAGLEGAHEGEGAKYRVQDERVTYFQTQFNELKNKLDAKDKELGEIDRQLADLDKKMAQAEATRIKDMGSLNKQMEEDPRFVPLAQGIFADVSTLCELFNDPIVGAGAKITFLVIFSALSALEMLALISLNHLVITEYDYRLRNKHDEGIARADSDSLPYIEELRERLPMPQIIPFPPPESAEG